MKKRVIFLTESMIGAGGVVRVITTWSNFFVKKGYNCEIFSVYKGKPFFELNEKIKFTIVNYLFKNKILSLPINILLILPILLKSKNSILIVNKSAYIEPIYLWRKLGLFKSIKLVYFSHGGNGDFESFYMSRRSTKHRVKMIFNIFDNVICLYKNVKKTPKEVIDNKITYIKNPCPLSVYNQESENKTVVYIGRVTKEKGIDVLIKSWAKIDKKDWTLKIVGDGIDKKEFIHLSEKLKLKNIIFLEQTNNVEYHLKNSTISVLPSLFEGFGLSIIESMSQGAIIISTKTDGGKKLINHHDNGLLVEISDIDDLAEKLIIAIESKELRRKLRENAYIKVKEFDIEKLFKNWNGIL
ncbi:glycosyltransferase [Arsenophonus nasoniae]|uniref:Glycosyltransferase n=1 Tax=Arsenophonus nasoniae TaxID=638 RepID=A0AA95GZU0_9GAMM|nr:glycosyltransferase [Arsenophonus nasoniae]WGM03805.1 glycosyltransferase [Arsenophonus nasoniae]